MESDDRSHEKDVLLIDSSGSSRRALVEHNFEPRSMVQNMTKKVRPPNKEKKKDMDMTGSGLGSIGQPKKG